jgi:AcrR family transcriptional regulator
VEGDPWHRLQARQSSIGGWGKDRRPPDRRARLIDAFTRVAAERGYEQVTIEEVAAAAGLPRAAFFEYFESKRHCLGAAYDAFFERLTEQARQACAAEEAWPAGVRAAVNASFEFLLETASRARLFMVEAVAGGLPLFERELRMTARLAEMLEDGRRRTLPPPDLPPSVEWVLVAGVLTRVSELLLAEEPSALIDLQPEVVELVLTPYVGAGNARRLAIE